MNLGGRLTGYVVVGAIAAALLFWTFGKIDSWMGEQDAMIVAASKAALDEHYAHVAERTRAAKRERQLLLAGRALLAQKDSIGREAEALVARSETTTVTLPWVRPLLILKDQQLAACVAATDSLLAGAASCEQRAAAATADADNLAAKLKDQLKVRPKRCWLSVGAGVAAGRSTAAGATFGVTCGLARIPLLP